MKYAFLLILLVSCAPYKAIHLERLSLGMSKKEVIAALRKKPDNVVGAIKGASGLVEVIQYSRSSISGMLEEQYWLYFLDNKLVQWGSPGDWEKEADKIIEVRVQ